MDIEARRKNMQPNNHSVRPVYIIGCPRSGNTLLGALLNKHPDFLVLFEGNTFSVLYRLWRYRRRTDERAADDVFMQLVTDIYDVYLEQFEISHEDLTASVLRASTGWADMLDGFMRLIINRSKPSASWWGDKTPHHVGYVQKIQHEYPDARFIYTYRDPRDVVASMSKTTFPHTTDSPLLNAEVVRQYLEVYEMQRRLANRDVILEIRYEDLVRHPERITRRMCVFLQVEYRAEMLEEADDRIRHIIGWPNNKAWNKVVPQPGRIPNAEKYVEAYLDDWICTLGYDRQRATNSHLYLLLARLRIFPFWATRRLLTIFWSRKYADFPFFMQKYPSARNYIHWLTGI